MSCEGPCQMLASCSWTCQSPETWPKQTPVASRLPCLWHSVVTAENGLRHSLYGRDSFMAVSRCQSFSVWHVLKHSLLYVNCTSIKLVKYFLLTLAIAFRIKSTSFMTDSVMLLSLFFVFSSSYLLNGKSFLEEARLACFTIGFSGSNITPSIRVFIF